MKLFFQMIVLFILNGLALTTYAATKSAAELNAEMRSVTAQTRTLMREVKALRTEVRKLKAEKKTRHSGKPIEDHKLKPKGGRLTRALRFLHPITVTTSPYLGMKTNFDASDLLQQHPSMNEDLVILRHRQLLQQQLLKEGSSLSDRAIVEISGGIEGQVLYGSGYGGANGSVNLSTAELDINAIASSWANVFFSIEFDDSPTITGTRVPNSRLYLRRGFLTLGNLDVIPVYLSIGQMYVPFGYYAGFPFITSPTTKSLARVLARAILLGYVQGPFYASIYGFTGNMTTGGSQVFKQGGGNIGVKGHFKNGSYDIGAGVISSIADAEGMQNNGKSIAIPAMFRGFGESIVTGGPAFNNLRRRVPAADGHAELTVGPVTFIGEYISVLRTFNPADMTFNGNPACPSALHAQINFLFHGLGRPFTFGVGYSQTWQALALNLPRRSFNVGLATSIWKDTIESIEWRHDVDYAATDLAMGGTPAAGPGPLLVLSVPTAGSGGTRNIFLVQVGVYF